MNKISLKPANAGCLKKRILLMQNYIVKLVLHLTLTPMLSWCRYYVKCINEFNEIVTKLIMGLVWIMYLSSNWTAAKYWDDKFLKHNNLTRFYILQLKINLTAYICKNKLNRYFICYEFIIKKLQVSHLNISYSL